MANAAVAVTVEIAVVDAVEIAVALVVAFAVEIAVVVRPAEAVAGPRSSKSSGKYTLLFACYSPAS